jgi:hypothetical protein
LGVDAPANRTRPKWFRGPHAVSFAALGKGDYTPSNQFFDELRTVSLRARRKNKGSLRCATTIIIPNSRTIV